MNINKFYTYIYCHLYVAKETLIQYMRVEHMPSLGQALYVFSVVGWVAGRERAFDIINDIGKKKIVPKFI